MLLEANGLVNTGSHWSQYKLTWVKNEENISGLKAAIFEYKGYLSLFIATHMLYCKIEVNLNFKDVNVLFV